MPKINTRLCQLTQQYLLVGMFSLLFTSLSWASSHREAPLIANDPLADNTDLYAFRSPDAPNTITIIANFIPAELPYGGPNYHTFGENIQYEIHIDNDASIPGDEITYRFTFNRENQDPTTFFNIRLGMQNLKTTYTMEKSTDGGMTFTTIVMDGIVPPVNIGPRSIDTPGLGLGMTYEQLITNAITTADTGEQVYCGPADDPFFVDLGGIFDLGDAPRQNSTPEDGLAMYNVHSIAIQVPIADLLKAGAPAMPTTILDPDYVIGVWASANRRAIRTLSTDGTITDDPNSDWIQVSRIGMPLTNEVIMPISQKDFWNRLNPYDEIDDVTLDQYFYNPELALYMDDDESGGAVPAFTPLRVQEASLQSFDFTNGANGLFGLKGMAAVDGTALAEPPNGFGHVLLPAAASPRSVDLWPIFHTGVPNARPYQLATGKNGDPLAAGKPFIHNFLPNGGDMLRLNMAVPVTPRDDDSFSSLGLIAAAVAGLTDPTYTGTSDLEFIPNMDGFPNGRRLEDDVTRIELQAVAGVVLAAIGLWYDDYDPMTSPSPVTAALGGVLGYKTGVEKNDELFTSTFPFVALPHRGTDACSRVTPLPLSLTVFNAYALEKSNQIEWVTSTEQNVQWHIVERSENGKDNWAEIGRRSSKGPSASPSYYEFEDKKPLAAAYYRLRSIDTGAKNQFSEIIFLERGQASIDWNVLPNPAHGNFEIIANLGDTKVAYIMVINVLGKVVTQQRVDLVDGQLSTQMDCSSWTPGMYFVNMVAGNRQVVQKLEIH